MTNQMRAMRVALVSASTVSEFEDREEIESESVRESALAPQLGILSLAAVLENLNYELRLINLNRSFLQYKEDTQTATQEFSEFAAQLIVEEDADLFGFGTICSSYPLTIRIAEVVKAARPNATILLGGPQASIVDLRTLAAFPSIDLILRGEAELTLPALLQELQGSNRLERVPGLSYRSEGQPKRNESAPVIQDLDALPSPAYHLTGELAGATEAALELGRGCPFSCTFCSTNDFFRRKFRLRSPERVLRDMQSIHSQYGISRFDLVHDMFTVDRRRVVAFCDAVAASKTRFTWACSARTDCIDEELMDLMRSSGCYGIFFGIEVGSERMQKIIDKHLDIKRAEQMIDYAERLGIITTVSLITGFPEETHDDLRHTVSMFVHSARCPQSTPQLNLLAPLAGTPIYEQHKHELILEELCSDMSHQGRSQDAPDRALIERYPEIFPNFYLSPMAHLDRATLIELREFCLAMKARFRWLLVAIHQNSDGLLDFYTQWHQRRLELYPDLKGSELRQYYRTKLFKADFVSFALGHAVSAEPPVKALLDYEIAAQKSVVEPQSCQGKLIEAGTELWWSDVPVRKGRTRVLELSFDMQDLIDSLKSSEHRRWKEGIHFYAWREVSRDSDRLDQVSDWMAALLRACNGKRDIEAVVQQLASDIPQVEAGMREYVYVQLLQGAQAQGTIEIYRPRPLQREGTIDGSSSY